MEKTSFIWKNGEFLPWDEAKTHVLSHVMHYGSGAFEGIRCYETPQGTAIFRLPEHTKRLFYSSEAIGMKLPFTEEEINIATRETVKKNNLKAGYIRPLSYFGYGKMGLNPIGADIDLIIACWPWGKYLAGECVRIKTSQYIRIHPKSTIQDAKIVGHYVNSIMASLEVSQDERYDEALFLDFEGKIAEGPGENIFIIKDEVIYTPKLGTILNGITRDSVMTIARDKGYEVIEKDLRPDDLIHADEAFFTGTAAELTGISSLDGKKIGDGNLGNVSKDLKKTLEDVFRGKVEKYDSWLTYV